MHILIGLSVLVLAVGAFRFCADLYYEAKADLSKGWNTSPDNPDWNPDHPYWRDKRPDLIRKNQQQ